ncbi:MAG: efflux RND transporter permease subunit [Desulfobulbaceae bacterium]|jgi:HAE1 family hydrophobic/amphiphilic exporter-1|nr:efflux RND transporter permease subunit [Desulfobulbaceae bacterium]MDH3866142.1 efflux RND transporter permease subunit [Desulfobulbaceae bacterium]HKJ13504.1 efflux RND transporter permease subunit [Desulfobulbales bacterium]
MDIVSFSIKKPVTILVGIILVVLFGVISLQTLPYQLSPTVVEPVITVTTTWRGATPYEMEREIIEEQEKTLKGIPALTEMESEAFNGQSSISLTFKLGTNVDDALLRVSNKLNEVPSYPEGVDKPIINATGAATSPVIWIILKSDETNPRHIETYRTFFENEIRQHLERVEGVADLFIGSGVEDEMHIIVSPEQLAAYGLTINDLIQAIRGENVNVSAGNMGVGRRDFRIRTTGEFNSEEDIANVVLVSTGEKRVTVADVAEIKRGYSKRESTVIHNSKGGMAVGVKPEPGTNILAMTERVEEVVKWLNAEKLAPQNISLEWVYDQRRYINAAIDLIKQNILIGGMLAVIVLLIFLRSIRSTLVVATSIPISIIGTFIFMKAMGRNLNVVSLAGIAFAVGMLVDNAIVVIENIDRHRKMGKSPFQASYDGTREVWGAIIASSLTTIAVFLPVVFIQEEAGQLFRDIAIAVVGAVSLSLIVSMTVIPMFAFKLFSVSSKKVKKGEGVLARSGTRLATYIMQVVSLATRNWATRIGTVSLLILLAGGSVFFLMPQTDYLPQGNRNFVLSILVPPPGLSQQERQDIGEKLFVMAEPHLQKEHDGYPGILNMFYVARESIMLFGAMATDWDRAAELLPLFRRMIYSIPGMFGVSMQAGIFQSRIGRSRTIDVDISGDDLDRIVKVAGMMFGKAKQALPDTQVRPIPSIELSYPEVKIVPNRERLKANNMSAADLGVALDVLMDGRIVGDFKQEGRKTIDLVLKTDDDSIRTPEALYQSMIAMPGGMVVPVSTLADLERTTGMTQIRHLERNRTITLQMTPPMEVPLQGAMEEIEAKIIKPVREMGLLKGLNVRMSGAADKLTETREALKWNFILASAIAYLLMASLFGNFIYPLIIMLTVPLAGAGGFIGLKLLNLLSSTPQPMDILTMLGFVILIGIVVNNAILIVHQALNNVHYNNMEYREAVLESVRSRLRPIYMSATTSIFGMLPLVVFPGSGSELYRGLGSVIIGGLAVSTVFTVFIIPSILIFVIRMEKPLNPGKVK